MKKETGRYEAARDRYAAFGVDTDAAIDRLPAGTKSDMRASFFGFIIARGKTYVKRGKLS